MDPAPTVQTFVSDSEAGSVSAPTPPSGEVWGESTTGGTTRVQSQQRPACLATATEAGARHGTAARSSHRV